MGHDVHFLERLERVEAEDESLALSLYQDPELVRTILGLAEFPDGAERVALALNNGPESPHLVVTRTGAFVTCLGPGMATGSNPVLTRHQLEGMRVRAERVREALHLADSVIGDKKYEARPIMGRLMRAGEKASREDYELATTFFPLIARDLMLSVLNQFTALLDGLAHARPLLKAKKVTRSADIEALHKLHLGLCGFGHSLVILATDPHFFKRLPPEAFERFNPMWMGLRSRSVSVVARGMWSAARFAPLTFKPQRHDLDRAQSFDTLTCASLRLAVTGCRHAKLRDEGLRLLERARKTPPKTPGWEEYRNAVLDSCIVSLKPDSDSDTLKVALRQLLSALVLKAGWVKDPEAIPDDLLRWFIVSMAGAFNPAALKLLTMFVTFIADLEGKDFFLPRQYHEVVWGPEDTEQVLLDHVLDVVREDAQCRVFQPVTRPATPRRNEPCACGSGLKYKACCARKDAENRREVIFHHGRLKP